LARKDKAGPMQNSYFSMKGVQLQELLK